MDIEGLERVLSRLETGEMQVVACDLTQPSPLALEVLSARPYAFLDDAPLEERRAQAVMARRWMDPRVPPNWAGWTPRPSPAYAQRHGPIRATRRNCTMPCCGWVVRAPKKSDVRRSGATGWRIWQVRSVLPEWTRAQPCCG